MTVQIPKQITQLATVLLAAVLLLLSIWSGAANGQKQAQSELVAANAVQLAQGLKYFYNDQDRYPSADEYTGNQNLMSEYFSAFPPISFSSGSCSSSFVYQRPTATTYKLNFCLPAASGGYPAGWNQLTQGSN